MNFKTDWWEVVGKIGCALIVVGILYYMFWYSQGVDSLSNLN
jgi:hypothetical protein